MRLDIFIYYCGVHGAHTGPKFKTVVRKHPVQIGLLRQRRDGFVSMDAGREKGTVITRPFRLPAGRLHLNADARGGEVRVRMLDENGRLLASSQPLQGDQLQLGLALDKTVSPGKSVRLEFALRECKLYSYWFEPS